MRPRLTRQSRPAKQAGFTLLEMLVALIVLGFLMVGLNEGVRAGLTLRHAQIHRLGNTADLDATMRLLRGLLSHLPLDATGERLLTDSAGFAFRGEAGRVSFVGDLPTGIGVTRRADITLSVEKGSLVLGWRPHRHARPVGPPQPLTRTVLLDGVKHLDLAYWGAPANPGQQPGWQARWESPQAPMLIRVRLEFARSDPRRWPDLIAAAHQ